MDYHGGMVTRLNQSDFVKTALRLPPDVHAKIHEAASATGRSYNAEIVARLQASFQTDESEQREFEAWREVARLKQQSAEVSTMTMPLDTERALKEYAERVEALLAAREERMRGWWMQEFGYDPQAPQIERPASRGPTRSPNARKKPP